MSSEFSTISTHSQRWDHVREVILKVCTQGRDSVPIADREAVAAWIRTAKFNHLLPGELDLRAHRRALNLTQQQLGELVGASRYSIIRWEASRRVPNLELARRLANVLGLDPRDVTHLARSYRQGGTSRSPSWLALAAERYRPDWPLDGANLRAARELQGMSQAQLARRLGWTRQAVSNLERGLWKPDDPYSFDRHVRAALGLPDRSAA